MGKKSKRRARRKVEDLQQLLHIQQNRVPDGYGRVFEIGSKEFVQMPFVTDSLVTAIFERGGVPEHLNSLEAIKGYLYEAFYANVTLSSFFQALATGLEQGRPLINKPVQLAPHVPEKMTLLHWLCQYVFLNTRLNCRLSDEMVGFLLHAGADPNALRADNQTTPTFFAVKYASPRTIDMLLEAGANLHQHDRFGQTCFKNALEHPKPMVIRRLLEHLPATEMVVSVVDPGGEKFLSSLTDVMLGFAACTPGEAPPMSWVNLGVPDADDFLEAFMMIRREGARLTQRSSAFAISLIGVSVKSPTHPQIQHPELLQKLAQVLVGTFPHPESCRPEIQAMNETYNTRPEQDKEEAQICSICFESVRKNVTLYCGHMFCRECVLEHGKAGLDCPLCRVPLCRDVSSNSRPNLVSNLMGIDQKAFDRSGPRFFTNQQVVAEAKAQGIHVNLLSLESLRDKLETEIQNGVQSSQAMKPLQLNNVRNVHGGGPSTNMAGRGKFKLELASNMSLVSGTPPSQVNICPKDGMVSIEVSINGIPLLARISNQSLYTVLSKSMVDQLGLKRIGKLTSRKFVTFQGAKMKKGTKFTCLEPIEVCFQGIKVTLRNAVEISPDPEEEFMTTVQLGQDFLRSGLLSVIDVEVGEEGCYYRVFGEDTWPISPVSKESFRYYSHDGKTANLPLIHFDPFVGSQQGMILTISLRETVKFYQCNWCCRVFPDGMLVCGGCEEANYCDERCQAAARKIHKLKCGIKFEE